MVSPTLTPDDNRRFIDDLFEAEGTPDRDGERRQDPSYVLMKGALDVYGALVDVCSFQERWPRLIRWRSASSSSKFDLIRAVEWHYGYVLRERVRFLVKEMHRHGKVNARLDNLLANVARRFKAKTDPIFTPRGRHVHNYPLHHALEAQVAGLQLLEAFFRDRAPDQAPQISSYIKGRRSAATRALKRSLQDQQAEIVSLSQDAIREILPVCMTMLRPPDKPKKVKK